MIFANYHIALIVLECEISIKRNESEANMRDAIDNARERYIIARYKNR